MRPLLSFDPAADADRRKSPRRVCRVRASIDLPGHAPLSGRSVDIGLGGMAVHLPQALPAGLDCRVRFSLFVHGAIHQLDLPARTLGSVFLCDAVRLNLHFKHMPAPAAKLLGDYVRFHLY